MADDRNSLLTFPNDAEIERVVHDLRAVEHQSAWERTIAVGRLVFDGLLGGSEAEWRSRRGNKHLSLRRLVEHPQCPFRKSALCQAVSIHLLVKAQPLLRQLPGVSPTHVARTLGLEPCEMMKLLRATSNAGWSVRELSLRVRHLRRQAGERRGRPSTPGSDKAATLARRAVASLRRMYHQLGECDCVDDESTRSLLGLLDEISELVVESRRLPAFARKSGIVQTLPLQARAG